MFRKGKFIKSFKMAKQIYDMRFQTPSTFLLCGGSGSGKTTLTLDILKNIDTMFADARCKQKVIYYYSMDQPALQAFRKLNIVTDWIQGVPTFDDVQSRVESYHDCGGSIILIDDQQSSLSMETADLFTKGSHHLNCHIFLLVQNLFLKSKVFRDISLNSKYIFVFKNPRDQSQIVNFAKQFRPGNAKFIQSVYKDCTKKPYSYVCFDLSQDREEHLRIRGNILPSERPMTVYTEI